MKQNNVKWNNLHWWIRQHPERRQQPTEQRNKRPIRRQIRSRPVPAAISPLFWPPLCRSSQLLFYLLSIYFLLVYFISKYEKRSYRYHISSSIPSMKFVAINQACSHRIRLRRQFGYPTRELLQKWGARLIIYWPVDPLRATFDSGWLCQQPNCELRQREIGNGRHYPSSFDLNESDRVIDSQLQQNDKLNNIIMKISARHCTSHGHEVAFSRVQILSAASCR